MIKYQVFISSTYIDLFDERQKAVEAILRGHNIPAGMELFSAGNETQLEVIKDWIDESDIYMLLLGGRYGSIEPQSQLSYTEFEYRYAIEKGKPIFALVISDEFLNLKIQMHGKLFIELDNRDKYFRFKELVLSRVCKSFSSLDDIMIETTHALSDIINNDKYKLQGWIRNNPTYNGYQKLKNYPKDAMSYGIRITTPKSGDILLNPITLYGTFEKLPPKGMFFCIELNPQLKTYWPKNEIFFDDESKKIESVIGLGQGDDKDRIVLIVAVGKLGKQIIDDFYLTPMNRGLSELSFDMVIVDQVRINLKKE